MDTYTDINFYRKNVRLIQFHSTKYLLGIRLYQLQEDYPFKPVSMCITPPVGTLLSLSVPSYRVLLSSPRTSLRRRSVAYGS